MGLEKNFRKRTVCWTKIAEQHVIDTLKHSSTCTIRTAEEQYTHVERVLAGTLFVFIQINLRKFSPCSGTAQIPRQSAWLALPVRLPARSAG